MRPIWKGHITFGLVNVPVTLYPAEQRSDLQLHMIDSRDFSRVRYERVNAETGEEVPWDQVVRGYEYNDGDYVLVEEEELKKAAPEATKSVEIESFIDLASIDPIYYDRPYFLEPDKKGQKGYVLLRETLRESKKAGLARVVIRTRQYLAAMAPRDNALMLYLLRYQQEIRSFANLQLPGSPKDVGVSAAEKKMARTLVESMVEKWSPEKYHDEYRDTLMKWIEKKIQSGAHARTPPGEDEQEEPPAPINLMAALKESLSRNGPLHASSTPAKKAPKRRGGTKSRRNAG